MIKIKNIILLLLIVLLLPYKAAMPQGYENLETSELTYDQFIQQVLKYLNFDRGLQGLLPLEYDPVASYIAKKHALDQINNEYVSYCNLEGKCPDERYTLAGGTGAVVEIIKGFEDYESNISFTPLLAKHLVEALKANEDDSGVIFSPFLTHIGVGVAKDDLKKRFVSVVEFLTIGGEFIPLKNSIVLGEEINISGKVKDPFKFKAVSIAYSDREGKNPVSGYFDADSLNPYFPPQDYIAYGNKSKATFLNILKGIGFIGAIGASPFTGGASAILAPIFLHSLRTGTPREIPLKGGIKLSSDGRFSGKIKLNYKSMTGLYYVSVLGEVESIKYPIVLSRRTVRVTSPL